MVKHKTNHAREIDKAFSFQEAGEETPRSIRLDTRKERERSRSKYLIKNRCTVKNLSKTRKNKKVSTEFKRKCEMFKHYHEIEEANIEQENIFDDELGMVELWMEEEETEDLPQQPQQ